MYQIGTPFIPQTLNLQWLISLGARRASAAHHGAPSRNAAPGFRVWDIGMQSPQSFQDLGLSDTVSPTWRYSALLFSALLKRTGKCSLTKKVCAVRGLNYLISGF